MAESMIRTTSFRERNVNESNNPQLNQNRRTNLNHNGSMSNNQRYSKPCRFFQHGACRRGNACLFSHDVAVNDTRNNTNFTRTVFHSRQNNSHNMPSTSSTDSSAFNNTLAATNLERNNEINENQQLWTEWENSNNTVCNTRAIVKGNNERVTQTENQGGSSKLSLMNQWVDAPEFIPSPPRAPKSYAQAVNPEDPDSFKGLRLCPYATKEGYCKYPPGACNHLHGDICELCGRGVLHPFDEDLRKRHHQDCIKQHEKDMEVSFAVARSKDKTCGICFEIIMEKAMGEQRFGILQNCNHCFCLTCIRKWRQARQFENKIIRACPECRLTSDFVCPSVYWVDTKEDKTKLIDDYKKALAKKDCKYFKKGTGKCPFGNKCFYLHQTPDGRKLDVGPPPRQRRRRNLDNHDFDVLQVILWEFMEERENPRGLPWESLDDLDDWVTFISDTDESDLSEYDIF